VARVYKTRRAEDDLEAIWLYIAEDSPDAADRWLDYLLDKALILAENPDLGRARPELLPDIEPDLRCFPVKAYMLLSPRGWRDRACSRLAWGSRHRHGFIRR
jgi:toxin ParE1/3/4